MKYDDYSFKLVAAVIIAGVIVAFAGPDRATNHINAAPKAPVPVHAVAADSADSHPGSSE
jgi:hypothetical protein